MSDLLDDAAKRANRYLESLDTRSVAPAKEAVAALAGFDQAFPEHTSAAEAVLAELDEIGSPATMASAGGRFFGFVTGGALSVTGARKLARRHVGSKRHSCGYFAHQCHARERLAALGEGHLASALAKRRRVCHLRNGRELFSTR